MPVRDWISFWASKQSIYVNAHHHAAHYRRIAEDLRRFVPPGSVMLDYGCGEALAAPQVAEAARRLILCEAAPSVRAAIAARVAGNVKISVATPDEAAALPSQSIDVIVLHSVAQ